MLAWLLAWLSWLLPFAAAGDGKTIMVWVGRSVVCVLGGFSATRFAVGLKRWLEAAAMLYPVSHSKAGLPRG